MGVDLDGEALKRGQSIILTIGLLDEYERFADVVFL